MYSSKLILLVFFFAPVVYIIYAIKPDITYFMGIINILTYIAISLIILTLLAYFKILKNFFVLLLSKIIGILNLLKEKLSKNNISKDYFNNFILDDEINKEYDEKKVEPLFIRSTYWKMGKW